MRRRRSRGKIFFQLHARGNLMSEMPRWILLFGGMDADMLFSGRLYVLDLHTLTWVQPTVLVRFTSRAPPPAHCHAPRACAALRASPRHSPVACLEAGGASC